MRLSKGILLSLLFCSCAEAQTLKLYDSFDSGAISADWGQALYSVAAHYTPNTAQEKFVSSPTKAGAKALHYYALVGTNELEPVTVTMPAAQMTTLFGGTPSEIYVEWHEFFATGYPWPSSSQKLLRIGYYDDIITESRKEFGLLVQTSNADVNAQYFCGAWGDSSKCSVSDAINSNEAHPMNQWVEWGYHVKLNTPGSSDGFVKVYKNDVLYLSHTGKNLRGTDTRGFNFLWIGGNYSMLASGTLAGSGSRYIDEVRIYDGYPSASTRPKKSLKAKKGGMS